MFTETRTKYAVCVPSLSHNNSSTVSAIWPVCLRKNRENTKHDCWNQYGCWIYMCIYKVHFHKNYERPCQTSPAVTTNCWYTQNDTPPSRIHSTPSDVCMAELHRRQHQKLCRVQSVIRRVLRRFCLKPFTTGRSKFGYYSIDRYVWKVVQVLAA